VAAGSAGQRVGAEAAEEQVVAGVAGDVVVLVRAGDVLDVREDVAEGEVAGIGRAVGEVDGDAGLRGGVVDGVDALAAVDRVGAGRADEGVVEGRTDDILSAPYDVAF